VATRGRTGLNHFSQHLRHWLPARDNQASGPGTSPSFHSKVYAALVKTCTQRNTAHLHPLCAQCTSLRSLDSQDKVHHQLSPPKLRIPIPWYTSYNTISPSYTPFPGVMTILALWTSLILVVDFHAVCRCTICGAQVDSEACIPGITMMVRVDTFTKAVTSNPQTNQPKFPNQLCLAPGPN